MTRSDLVERLALRHPTLTAVDHDRIVRLVFDTIAEQLVAGGGDQGPRAGALPDRVKRSATAHEP